jgi:hypothetical protein
MDDAGQKGGLAPALVSGIVLGLVVAAGAWVWSLLDNPAGDWTPQQAVELQEAQQALHVARSTPVAPAAGAPPESVDAEIKSRIDAAQSRVDKLDADLEYARSGRRRWRQHIALAGLALTILCGIGYFACCRDAPRPSKRR